MEHSSSKIIPVVAILRVSSTKQGFQGNSADDQKKAILRKIQKKNHSVVKWFEFIQSASEMAIQQPVLEVIEYCEKHPEIKYCYFKSIDRFTRGGSRVYQEFNEELAKLGVALSDVYGVISGEIVNTMAHLGKSYKWSKYSSSKNSEILEAERAKDELRDIMTRLNSGSIAKVRAGYSIGNPPYGFENLKVETPLGKKAYILIPKKGEAEFIVRMFELSSQGKKLSEIIDSLNTMGFKTRVKYRKKQVGSSIIKVGKMGGIPLSEKQLRRYLTSTTYCAISTHSHLSYIDDQQGVEHYQPIVTQSEPLVSVKLWNMANKGKWHIKVNEDGTADVLKGETPERFTKKSKSNPAFPYKGYLTCHICFHPLKASASRSKSGKHIVYYHCSHNHKYWGTNGKKLHEVIEDLIDHLEFSDGFRSKFRDIMLEEWENRRDKANKDSVSSEKEVLRVKQEQRLILDTIKGISVESMRKQLETDYSKLEQQKVKLIEKRDKKEVEEVNIQTVIKYCNYWMEHLKELLLNSDKPLESARFFSLCFEELPTAKDLLDGTPKLSYLFRLNEEYKSSERTLGGTPVVTQNYPTMRSTP